MELQSLLDQLYSEPDFEKRRYIPDKLAKLGDWGATDALGKLIIDLQQPLIIRNEAVESLGKQGDPKAVQYLVQVLDDEDEDIRRTAVWSLGQVGTTTALEPVFKMVNDPSVEVRRWVAKSAGRIRDDAVIGKLASYISDISDNEVRVIADIIRAVTTQIKRVPGIEYEFWSQHCYTILQNDSPRYVKQAAMLLLNELFTREHRPDTKILLSIFQQLPSNDPLVRPNIILAMGHAKETEFLRSQEHTNTIIAMGIAGQQDFVEGVLENQTDENKIIAALEAYRYLNAIPDLARWYNHQNITIQSQALQLHAQHHLPIDPIIEAYNQQRGKFKAIELLRYYGNEGLEILATTAIEDEKVARQNSVYSLISDEILEGEVDHNKVRSILGEVVKHEKIWHIRRDARIGIERINNIEN